MPASLSQEKTSTITFTKIKMNSHTIDHDGHRGYIAWSLLTEDETDGMPKGTIEVPEIELGKIFAAADSLLIADASIGSYGSLKTALYAWLVDYTASQLA